MAAKIESRYYTCKEVMAMLGVGEGKAYSIIRQLNKELERQGYITINGKVHKEYFESKLFPKGVN